MTAEQIFKKEGIYFGEATIDGVPCTIGYIKKFRWRWIASQLNIFIIVGKTDDVISRNTIEAFSNSGFQYALNNSKGWPRGVQSAICSIAILEGVNINDDAISFCEKFSKKHWSAFEIPVVYDGIQKKGYKIKSTPIWGIIFFSYLLKEVDRIVAKLS
ncbi:MAG TPA: hypothetical protein VIK89_06945 [Cytophagaceae bacterium]